MRARTIQFAGASAMGAIALGSAVPAAAQCLPLMCGFSEKGKKGPFIEQEVDPENLKAADETIRAGVASGSLGAATIDSGELYGSGLSMPQTEAALGKMLADLSSHWPYRQPTPPKFRIVASISFSPLAHSDDTIVVPIGMLEKATSDDEIAWLVGHEFSHLALGHFADDAGNRKRAKFLGDAASLVQGGSMLANMRFSFSNNQIQTSVKDAQKLDALTMGVYRRSREVKMISTLTNSFFGRRQEDQADVLGFDLAYAAGYSDEGYGSAFARIQEEAGYRDGLIGSIGKGLEEYAQAEGLQMLLAADKGGGALETSGKGLLDNLADNLMKVALNEFVKYYSSDHRDTNSRKNGVNKYADRAYPELEFRDTRTQWLDAVRSTPEYEGAKKATLARETAYDQVQAGDRSGAVATLLPILKTPYGNSPFILNVLADAYFHDGQPEQAEKYYSAAMAREASDANPYGQQSLGGFKDHAEINIQLKKYARAEEIIAEASRRFGDDTFFLPQKVRIAVMQNRIEDLGALLVRCSGVGDEGLARECRTALLIPESQDAYKSLTPMQRAEVDEAVGRASQAAQANGLLSSLGSLFGKQEKK